MYPDRVSSGFVHRDANHSSGLNDRIVDTLSFLSFHEGSF